MTEEDKKAMAESFLKIEGRALRLSMGCDETRIEWELFQIAWKAALEYERTHKAGSLR